MRLSLLSLGLLLATACLTEAKVEAAIDDANYCDAPEDCVIAGSTCPFGCAIAVNADEVEEIGALLDDWSRRPDQCAFDCLAVSSVDCVAQRCEVTFDEP